MTGGEHAVGEEVKLVTVAGDVGARVAQILKAAEETAEQILADAKAEGRGLADELLAQAQREAERVRTEADGYVRDTRAAGETYASQQRRQSEQDAARLLAEAEQQARATREAAEAMAKQIESESRARIHELGEQARLTEARLQRMLLGMRDAAERVEDALIDRGEMGPETLLEALDVEHRTAP